MEDNEMLDMLSEEFLTDEPLHLPEDSDDLIYSSINISLEEELQLVAWNSELDDNYIYHSGGNPSRLLDSSSISSDSASSTAQHESRKNTRSLSQKQKLQDLRQQAERLHSQLNRLKVQKGVHDTQDFVDQRAESRERQQDRRQAEQENTRLRQILERQAFEALQLSEAVQKDFSVSSSDFRLSLHDTKVSDTVAQITAEDRLSFQVQDQHDFQVLSEEMHQAHEHVDQYFSNLHHIHGELPKDKESVCTTPDASGRISTSILRQIDLPLTRKVVSKAIWRLLVHETGGLNVYFRLPYFVSDDTFAEKTGLMDLSSTSFHTVSKRMVRRYREADRDVIITRVKGRPMQIMGKAVTGITLDTTLCFICSQEVRDDGIMTVMHMGFTYRSIPDNDKLDWSDNRLGELLNVVRAQRTVSTNIANLTVRLLLDEDSKEKAPLRNACTEGGSLQMYQL